MAQRSRMGAQESQVTAKETTASMAYGHMAVTPWAQPGVPGYGTRSPSSSANSFYKNTQTASDMAYQ